MSVRHPNLYWSIDSVLKSTKKRRNNLKRIKIAISCCCRLMHLGCQFNDILFTFFSLGMLSHPMTIYFRSTRSSDLVVQTGSDSIPTGAAAGWGDNMCTNFIESHDRHYQGVKNSTLVTRQCRGTPIRNGVPDRGPALSGPSSHLSLPLLLLATSSGPTP